jgi:hypothetical protein
MPGSQTFAGLDKKMKLRSVSASAEPTVSRMECTECCDEWGVKKYKFTRLSSHQGIDVERYHVDILGIRKT